MAFTTVLTTALLVTCASAGFPAWNEDFPFPGFPAPMVSLRFATPQAMAGVPKFPFPFFGGFPFPTMPPMGFPAIPSVQDIAGSIPAGGTYNGVMVSTQSESKRNEDGTVVKSGGSTVMINDNGKVTVEKTGDSPPEIVPPTNIPAFKKIGPKPMKFSDMFGPSSEEIKTISPEELEDYVPSKGEKFKGHAVVSSSFSTNVNGQKKEGAVVTKVKNDDGTVSTHNFVYQSDDSQ